MHDASMPGRNPEASAADATGRRRRICILLQDVRGGGAERIMLRLAEGFLAAGRQVDLLLVKKQGAYVGMIPKDARVIDLGRPHVLGAVPAIARYIRANRPDAMLAALTHVNIAAVLARFLARVPMRLVLSERNQISMKASTARGLREFVTFKLVRLLYPVADAIVAVSSGVATDLEAFARFKPGSVSVVYNPITHDGMRRQAKEEVTHPWFAPGSPPVILGVGRLHRQKGFDVLIRAFHQLRASGLDCRLVIAGEGDERVALEELAQSLGVARELELLGFVPNPYALMSRAGVFVLSSRFEGLPGVLLEAMFCGAPVVATDCPSGAAEILEDGKYGTLVPVDDHQALAEAISRTLRARPSPSVSRAMEFNVDKAINEYLAVLENS